MVPFQTIPPSEPFGWKDFFDSPIFCPSGNYIILTV